MTLPLNDLKRTYERDADALDHAILSAVRSGWWLSGEENRTFCDSFARYIGVTNCLGVANGTDALEIAMRILAQRSEAERREVVTVPNAGGYSTIALRQVGLIPVYADIERGSQLASTDSILACLTTATAFVVITHLYGGVFDVEALRSAMDARGFADVLILEDCAQAHGAELRGRKVGSLGDIATFSFYPTKNLGAFGDGGAIVTSDPELAKACEALRQYGWASKYDIARPGGRNSRLDEVQAAILSVQLQGLDESNARRIAILERYAAACGERIALVRSPHGTVGHLAILLCNNRDSLRQHLKAHDIATDIHYPILDCHQTGWQGLPQRCAPGGVGVAEASVPCLLTIPCFPGMTDSEVEIVCKALSSWTA